MEYISELNAKHGTAKFRTRLRESKFRVEHEHKLLRDEVAAVRMRTKALALERARSLAAAGERRGELGRREEAAAAHDHRVAELERKIARMRGTMSPENRWVGGNRDRSCNARI